MDLESLLQGCKKNNRQAQSELYHQYKDILYLVSLKYCRNITEAEDTLHDAFIIIFNNIKSYSGKGSLEGWMKRIVINKSIDKYKKNKLFINDLKETFLTAEDVEISENTDISLNVLLEYIQQLPDQYRLVFNLYQLDGYSHKEIAKMLSISESTSKSNFHRAKVCLKEKIENHNYLNL